MMKFARSRGLAGVLLAGGIFGFLTSAVFDLVVAAEAKSGPAASSGVKAVTVRIADPTEPGTKLVFGGHVLDYGGRPLAKAAVVAYHTDAKGYYNPPRSESRVPRIRAVAVTAEDGSFRFETIRPGAYPDGGVPAHIHMVVTAPAHHPRYLEFWFADDPLVTDARRREVASNDGFVVVAPRKGADGVATFLQDITLRGN